MRLHSMLTALCVALLGWACVAPSFAQSTYKMEEVACLPIFDMNKKVVCAGNKVLQFRPSAKYVLNERFGVDSSFNDLSKNCQAAHGRDSHRVLHRFSCLNQAEGWQALISFVVTTPPDPSLPLVVRVSNILYKTCVSADANKELGRVVAKFGRKDLLSDDDGLQYQRNNVFDAMNVYHHSGSRPRIPPPRDIALLRCAGDQRLEFQIKAVNVDEEVYDYFQSLLAGRAKRMESKF